MRGVGRLREVRLVSGVLLELLLAQQIGKIVHGHPACTMVRMGMVLVIAACLGRNTLTTFTSYRHASVVQQGYGRLTFPPFLFQGGT